MEQAGSFAQYRATHWAESVGVIAVTSTIALSYNLVHSLMIQRTSAVATTVLGEVKIVGLMLASYLILGKWPSTTPACMARGCVLQAVVQDVGGMAWVHLSPGSSADRKASIWSSLGGSNA